MSCIEWTGCRNRTGYGILSRCTNGKQRSLRAHRWIWEQTYGPIPEDKVVMHVCDNRACINVDHLRLGTQADNIADMVSKGRNRHRSSNKVWAIAQKEMNNEQGNTGT